MQISLQKLLKNDFRKIKKFLSEVSLIDQPFVKDPSLNISDLLKNNHNSVLSFIRYEVGEGIEVEKKDFC